MAERRMFTKQIIDSDAFLDMPLSAQALYFHLCMRADDDGFVNSPKRIAKLINASDDDLKILLMKRFILVFESGVIVIKHWRMHNTLKSDRYKPTDYQEELAQLSLKPNKSYTDRPVLDAEGQPAELPAARTATAIAEEAMTDWSADLRQAVMDWLSYKKEKRQPYKEIGLKTLLSQIRKAADQYGEAPTIDVIRNSMASGYAGITLDRLSSPAYKPPTGNRVVASNNSSQPVTREMLDKIRKKFELPPLTDAEWKERVDGR